MNYLAGFTMMLSEAKNPEHERHLYEIHELVLAMINQLVPEIVKQELATTYLDLLVKIQTQLNGRNVDFPDVVEYIKDTIEAELQKALR